MKYMDYLQKYQDLGQRDWKDFKEILDEIDKVKLERVENPTLNAVVVLGYSGNGKTTAIKNFILNHPEYKIISKDSVVTLKGLIYLYAALLSFVPPYSKEIPTYGAVLNAFKKVTVVV